MSKTQGKSIKGRPGVMPPARRAPNPRTPKAPRILENKDGQEEGAEDTKPPVAEGQAVEPPVDAQAGGGSQSSGQGGGGNQP